MAAALPEHLEDQVGGAVEHLGLLFEAGGRAHESAQLNELLDLVERAGVLANQRHDVQGTDLGRSGRVLDANVGADHALELELAVPVRNHTGGVEQLANLLHRHVGGQRLRRFGKLDPQRP